MALKSKPLDRVRPDVPVHLVSEEDMIKITFNAPKSVRQKWKAEALRREMTMTDLIFVAMKKYLDT